MKTNKWIFSRCSVIEKQQQIDLLTKTAKERYIELIKSYKKLNRLPGICYFSAQKLSSKPMVGGGDSIHPVCFPARIKIN